MTDPRPRAELRHTFDSAAERYDRVRPGYPAAVFDDIVALGGLVPGSRFLEIGCGTGQATLPLAQRGYGVVAVELGAELAAIARLKLAPYPNVEIVVADFERWPLPPEQFDAVISATAFHWLDPDMRVAKAADALRPDGTLAIIGTEHVAGGTEQSFADAQECYERWDPSTPAGLRLQPAAEVVVDTEEFDTSGRFGPVAVRRYEWDAAYSTAEYIELLLTYSGHLALEHEAQRGLLECIRALIDGRYGGRITKRHMTELRLARRT